MVVLRTDRLVLREFVAGDRKALHAVESHPEVARYQSFAARSEDESRAYVLGAVADAAEDPRRTWDLAVVLAAEGRLIGRCGFGLTDDDRAQAMLWYTLHPAEWGRGYATEAARAVVGFAFRDLGLHRVWADCDPANPASWRVLEKIGMRREGHLRENARIKGEWVDSLIYAILAREWPAANDPRSPGRRGDRAYRVGRPPPVVGRNGPRTRACVVLRRQPPDREPESGCVERSLFGRRPAPTRGRRREGGWPRTSAAWSAESV